MRARVSLVLAVALSLSACGGSSPSVSPSAPSSSSAASGAPAQSAGPGASLTASAGPSIPPAGTIYIIRKGDTLYAIARRFHLTLKALRAANPSVTDPTKIRIGQKLVIPAP